MEKLKQGDYVTNLTNYQFDELIKIEGRNISITWGASIESHPSFILKSMTFNNNSFGHSHKVFIKQELPFEVFKQRAINTFKK